MKNKKILFIIIPIILVVIIGIIIVSILYFKTDAFKSNDTLFIKYIAQNDDLLEILKNENSVEQKQFKSVNTYTSNGKLTISIAEGTNSNEIDAITQSRHDTNTGRTYSEISLKNGEMDLIKMSYINSDDVYAIKYDEVVPNYIGIRNSELKTLAKNLGLMETNTINIPDQIDFTSIENLIELTNEQKTHIKDTYAPIILQSIEKSKFAKSKKQISVDGRSYVTNEYSISMDNNTIKQIATNCLAKLKDDNTTLVIISNKLAILGFNSEYTDISQLSQKINDYITQIQGTQIIDGTVQIMVHEYKGKTIRTTIKDSNNEEITIDRVSQDNNDKAIVTIKKNNAATSMNVLTGESDNNMNIVTSQITLQKIKTDATVTNQYTFIPNITNLAQKLTLSLSSNKIQNNSFKNTTDISIINSYSSDGTNATTINTSYVQDTQIAEKVDEILELKNSNTIILNNYTKEQIMPFLTSAFEKAIQIIPGKMQQLGIDFGTGFNNNGTTNINLENN